MARDKLSGNMLDQLLILAAHGCTTDGVPRFAAAETLMPKCAKESPAVASGALVGCSADRLCSSKLSFHPELGLAGDLRKDLLATLYSLDCAPGRLGPLSNGSEGCHTQRPSPARPWACRGLRPSQYDGARRPDEVRR